MLPKRPMLPLAVLAIGLHAVPTAAQTPAAPPAPAAAPAAAQPAKPATFLVVYKGGPKYAPSQAARDQLLDHARFVAGLHEKGLVKAAGPFTDTTGGAMFFQGENLAAAKALIDTDPAVTAELFVAEVHAWNTLDWEALSKRLKAVAPAPAPPN